MNLWESSIMKRGRRNPETMISQPQVLRVTWEQVRSVAVKWACLCTCCGFHLEGAHTSSKRGLKWIQCVAVYRTGELENLVDVYSCTGFRWGNLAKMWCVTDTGILLDLRGEETNPEKGKSFHEGLCNLNWQPCEWRDCVCGKRSGDSQVTSQISQICCWHRLREPGARHFLESNGAHLGPIRQMNMLQNRKKKTHLHRGRGIFSSMCSIFVIKYSTYKKFNM